MNPVHSFEGLRYLESEYVYPVSEDTLFLLKALKEELISDQGNLLDMGCGSGLITLLGSSLGWSVTSVDLEPLALSQVRNNLSLNGLNGDQVLSDLFQGIPKGYHGKFDIISFNPPYVNGNRSIYQRRVNLPLLGGSSGTDVAIKFLRDVYPFLSLKGKAILLSCDNWMFEDGTIDRPGLNFTNVLARIDIDGERFSILEFSKNPI